MVGQVGATVDATVEAATVVEILLHSRLMVRITIARVGLLLARWPVYVDLQGEPLAARLLLLMLIPQHHLAARNFVSVFLLYMKDYIIVVTILLLSSSRVLEFHGNGARSRSLLS